jgi:hypothetical protein
MPITSRRRVCKNTMVITGAAILKGGKTTWATGSLKAPMFSGADEKLLARAIYSTWQRIGYDAEAHVEGNDGAVEVCIDADRLTTDCGQGNEAQGKAADALIKSALDKHTYTKVLKALSKIVNLV